MSSIAIQPPMPAFQNAAGQPLNGGSIYVGSANQDPRSYPVDVFFDEAGTIPALQPLRTNGGHLVRNGAPTSAWVREASYSILVLDSAGRQVSYTPSSAASSVAVFGFVQDATGAVPRSAQEKLRERLSLSDFLTEAQREAVRTNDYAGIDITTFTAAVQAAFNAAHFGELEISAPAFIKVNAPIVWKEYTRISTKALPSNVGVVFYPDLSVSWPTLYPDIGLLTAEKYLYGNPGYPEITSGFWTGEGCGFQVRAHMDPLYATNKANVPDYGIVIWAPNESVYFERVQALNFRKHNWLCGGVSSVPTFVHCNGMNAGDGQDTIFGDAVTRAASAFSASVTVYWNVNGSTTLIMEAASSTDLDTLAPGDVLTINGATYTVSTVPVATASISERTVIGGVATTTRSYRRVTLGASLNANGRVYHSGIAFRNHPNLNFAPGVAAADGGRGNSGSARLFGFSGDSNQALVFVDGGQNLSIVSPKSEQNNTMVHVSGTNTGGGRAHIEVMGYRADRFGTFDGGLIRITGISRPSIRMGTGQIVSYTDLVNDQTPLGASLTTASLYGQGSLYYCVDASEVPHFTALRTPTLYSSPTQVSFFGATPIARPNITGSRGGNAALGDLLTKLASLGLITNGTTA